MSKRIQAVLLAGFIPVAGMALAQGVAQKDYMRGDVAAFHGDASTLARAVETVERTSGGKVLEIRFTDAGGAPGYHVAVLKDGAVEFMRFEQESGKLTPVDESSRPAWMLSMRTKEYIHEAEEAKIPLTEAIMTAEKSDGDVPAVAAGIAMAAPTAAVRAYNVLIDTQMGPRRVAVDADNDQIISDPQALAGWPS